jgi:hypothetical protein
MTADPVTNERPDVDSDALLCALVLAPRTFPRNRFFRMFEDPVIRRVQRRAKRVRGIIRQLVGHGHPAGEIVGEHVLEDRVLLRYQLPHLNYERTTSLAPLEAALIQYAIKRARREIVDAEPQRQVERALSRLEPPLDLERLPLGSLIPPPMLAPEPIR